MKYLIQFITSVCLIFSISACVSSKAQVTGVTDQKATAPSSGDKAEQEQQFSQIITEAIASAKRQGKTTVDIHLNEDPGMVQAKDVVTVNYKAVLDTGELLDQREQLQIVAGHPEAVPGLGEAVLGMAAEKKQVRIEPRNAFGEKSEKKEQHLSRIQSMPVNMAFDKARYAQRFKIVPKPGDRIQVNPYFESQVTEVTEDKIIVTNLAQDGAVDKAPFGETLTKVKDGTISLRLTPVIGAAFPLGEHKGRIISHDDKTFVVDLNHPLAGHAIDLDLEVTSIVKASQAAQKTDFLG